MRNETGNREQMGSRFLDEESVQKMSEEGYVILQFNIICARLKKYGVVLDLHTDSMKRLHIEATRMMKIGVGGLLWLREYAPDDPTMIVELTEVLTQYKFLEDFKAMQLELEMTLKFDEVKYVEPAPQSPGYVQYRFKGDSAVVASALKLPNGEGKPYCSGSLLEASAMKFDLTEKMLATCKMLADREEARTILTSQMEHLKEKYGCEIVIFDSEFTVKSQAGPILRNCSFELTVEKVKSIINEIKTAGDDE